MQGRTHFNPKAHNLAFAHGNQRGNDADCAFSGAFMDEAIERFIVGGATVGIAGAVLLYRSNED